MSHDNHLRPTPEQAMDGLAAMLVIPILLVIVPALASLNSAVAFVIAILPATWYVASSIVLPLTNSTPLRASDFGHAISDNRVQFRKTKTGGSRALQVFGVRYIIFKEGDLHPHYREWKAVIGHEYAHLVFGDAKYFHFVGLFVPSAIATLIYVSYLLLLSPNQNESSGPISDVVVATLLVSICIFVVFWIRQNLHSREYRADAYARNHNPEAFDGWLFRSLRSERRKSVHFSLNSALKWFTHPSFEKRSRALANGDRLQTFSLLYECLRSLGFVAVGSLGTVQAFMSVSTYYRGESVSPLLMSAIFLVILMPIASANAAISVTARRLLDQSGSKGLLAYLIAFPVIFWVASAAFYYCLIATGQYETLTAGLPPQPPGKGESGLFAFFVISLNYAFALLTVTLACSKTVDRRRFAIGLHVFVGLLSLVGSFLMTKLQWCVFQPSCSLI